MSKDKISSQEMVEQIAAKLSVSKRVAEEFLKSLFAEIEESLIKGEPVKIKNLGTFKMLWNEPRKSVNVQTGEVFTIDGYNKVTFTPDADLKEAVNEPYSHLESIELDGQGMPSFEIEKPNISIPEPLRNLTEQASEIRNLLSEINALSTPQESIETPSVDEKKLDIPDYDIILIDEEEVEEEEEELEELVLKNATDEKTDLEVEKTDIAEPEIVEIIESQETEIEEEEKVEEKDEAEINIPLPDIKEEEKEEKKEVIETPIEPIRYENVRPTISAEPVEAEVKHVKAHSFPVPPKKKRKGLRFLIWFVIILLVIGGGIYATYFTSSCIRCWVQYDLLSEANLQKMDENIAAFKGLFISNKTEQDSSTIIKDSTNKIALPETTNEPDTIAETQPGAPVDSFLIVFNKRRNYNEFLGEEAVTEGTRLTNIAQHYYGKKEFWVYIYEANRDNIVHPDRITPGTVVKIPKVDPRIIDKKNPRCLEKVRELHDIYVGKN